MWLFFYENRFFGISLMEVSRENYSCLTSLLLMRHYFAFRRHMLTIINVPCTRSQLWASIYNCQSISTQLQVLQLFVLLHQSQLNAVYSVGDFNDYFWQRYIFYVYTPILYLRKSFRSTNSAAERSRFVFCCLWVFGLMSSLRSSARCQLDTCEIFVRA